MFLFLFETPQENTNLSTLFRRILIFYHIYFSRNPSIGNVLNTLRHPRHLQVYSVKHFHKANNGQQKNESQEHLHQPNNKSLLLFGVAAGSAAAVFYLSSM